MAMKMAKVMEGRSKGYAFIYIFDKGNILMSQRYQLYSVSATTQYPNGSMDAHRQKRKKKTKKIKVKTHQGTNVKEKEKGKMKKRMRWTRYLDSKIN
jgi:hypothetical protein